jgi:transposase
MAKRSQIGAPERSAAVLALLRREEPAAQLARRYGVSEPTLYRWRDEFVEGGQAALAGGRSGANPQGRRIVELEQQVEKQHQVIGELTIANRILKKTQDGLR